MEQKRYMDIERLKPALTSGFEQGDYIVIQEKIDGANLSIRYDEETNTVKAFSRNRELNESNTLRGAWDWSQKLDVDKVRGVLGNHLILFMEWLVSHTVKYPEDRYGQAYCYDIYDAETEQYLPQELVEQKVAALGFNYVPVFYKGAFASWEELKSLVGKTELGGEYGEGIVVKNQSKLNNPRGGFYTKIVCEQFCETKHHKEPKPTDMNKLAERECQQALTGDIVTEARVQKLLHKMVDDGIIPMNWDEHHMATIAKNIGREVYYDCTKEEPETVEQIGSDFGKFAQSMAMIITREILQKRNNTV